MPDAARNEPVCRDCAGAHETGSPLCPVQALRNASTLVGKLVAGKYRIVRRIAEGGMAAVFEAENEVLGKRVALKMLLTNLVYSDQAVSRFYREARTVAALGHENIIEVYDLGITEDSVPFMVLELLSGQTLGQLIESSPHMEGGRAVYFVSQVLAGLDAAHRAGVVHRDLKPENVFIAVRPGGREVVKILDFGVSLVQSECGPERLTANAMLLGTAQYMAPEQVVNAAAVDARCDVHAAGNLLYELLSGRAPYPACQDFRETLRHVLQGEPAPLLELAPECPQELAAAVHRALSKDPAGRFQSAADMLDAIAPFLQWRATAMKELPRAQSKRSAAPSSAAKAHARTLRWTLGRRRMALLVAALVGLALLVALGFILNGRRAPIPARRSATVRSEPAVGVTSEQPAALTIEQQPATPSAASSAAAPSASEQRAAPTPPRSKVTKNGARVIEKNPYR